MDTNTELSERCNRILGMIHTTRNKQARKDLSKMYNAIGEARTAVDRESVECRRLHRTTVHYEDLVKKCNELCDSLEQFLTFSRLLYGG